MSPSVVYCVWCFFTSSLTNSDWRLLSKQNRFKSHCRDDGGPKSFNPGWLLSWAGTPSLFSYFQMATTVSQRDPLPVIVPLADCYLFLKSILSERQDRFEGAAGPLRSVSHRAAHTLPWAVARSRVSMHAAQRKAYSRHRSAYPRLLTVERRQQEAWFRCEIGGAGLERKPLY